MKTSLREGYFVYEEFRNFYLEGGNGEAVVFLHPLGASVELWCESLAEFASGHSVFALDFLGCGKSDKPDIPYHLQYFSERLLRFLDDRNLERAVLVGNSLGGHVAMMLAAGHPARVSKLVLANTSGLDAFPKPIFSSSLLFGARMARRIPFYPSEKMVRMILRGLYGSSTKRSKELARFYVEQMNGPEKQCWRRAFLRTLQSILEHPVDEEIAEAHVPTLIVWGGKDRLLGPRGGETLQRLIKGAKLVFVPDAGHFPQFEQPRRFNEVVQRFLNEG